MNFDRPTIPDFTNATHSHLNAAGGGVLTSSAVGLGNVENTALSTWAGSTNLTTLGTIETGTWNATAIGVTKGGTGATSLGNSLTNSGGVLDTVQDLRTSASPTFGGISVLNGAGSNPGVPVYFGVISQMRVIGSDDFGVLLLGKGTQSSSNRWVRLGWNSTSNYFTINDYESGADRLVVTGAGNVGIGTTNPDSTLHVAGDAHFGRVGGSDWYIQTPSSDLRFAGGTAGAHFCILPSGAGNVYIGKTSGVSRFGISGLPTSSAGLASGDIWNNGGVLNIV